VFELQFADNAALQSHASSDVQNNLNTIAETYQKAGLTTNTKKTEILSSGTDPPSQPSITVNGDTRSGAGSISGLVWRKSFHITA